jgi:hypothetical protein
MHSQGETRRRTARMSTGRKPPGKPGPVSSKSACSCAQCKEHQNLPHIASCAASYLTGLTQELTLLRSWHVKEIPETVFPARLDGTWRSFLINPSTDEKTIDYELPDIDCQCGCKLCAPVKKALVHLEYLYQTVYGMQHSIRLERDTPRRVFPPSNKAYTQQR